MSTVALLFAACLMGLHATEQRAIRDAERQPTTGTASVAGTVVTAEAQPQPVRRAVVTLSGTELIPSRSTVTDDDGRFTIAGLPAGRFTLIATRASYVTSVYGAKRPARPGTTIAVGEGARLTDLSVRLWRGAVIEGILRDDRGAPVEGIAVTAVAARIADRNGIFTLTNNGATTNEAGEFRIFGLAPGTYVVVAKPASDGGGELLAMADANVDAALEALRRRSATGAPASAASRPTPSSSLRSFDYAPVYFPGTAVLANAGQITLAAGQEQTGVDFALQRVPTSAVTGRVTRPNGTPAGGASLQLTAVTIGDSFGAEPPLSFNATSSADGTFRINRVTPGDYRLIARVAGGPGVPSMPAGGLMTPAQASGLVWATTDVSISGSDVSDLTLSLEPGMTIAGTIRFSSDTLKPPASLTQVRIALMPPHVATAKPGTAVTSLGFVPPTTPRADGSFEIPSVGLGTYRLVVYGLDSTAWWPQSARLGGRDLFDSDIDLTNATAAGRLEVLFSDQDAEISGSLQTATGSPASDLFVIVFPGDRTMWGRALRRVKAVRPGVDGRFTIGDLPPGDYQLAALADVDSDEWRDPMFFERIFPSSLKITLGLGEKRKQDLKMVDRDH